MGFLWLRIEEMKIRDRDIEETEYILGNITAFSNVISP
jgi:hypothetical protein